MGRNADAGPEGKQGSSFRAQENRQKIVNLLAAGDYERVATLLREAETAAGEDNVALSNVLAAARQLCLTCHQYHDEMEAHRRSLADAAHREKTLRQRIMSLLSLAAGEELVGAAEEREAARPAEADQPEPADRQAEEEPGLWKRFRTLVGLEKETPSTAVEQPDQPPPAPLVTEEPAPVPAPVPARETAPTPVAAEEEEVEVPDGAALTVYTLGPFRVYQDEELIEEWPSLKGRSIFKYLIAQRDRPVNKEVLMDLFWPDADPDSARNNLNVAIYGLRQAFRQIQPELSYVLFRDDHYVLNPELTIWVDVEEFRERFAKAEQLEQRGELAQAAAEYHAAEALYQGDFLEEDRYEEWLRPLRRQLRDDYLEALGFLSRYYFNLEDYGASITLCGKILAVHRWREEAHRLYMRCCSRQGQRYLALRQYHRCVEALAEELEAAPSESTVELYEKIRRGEAV